MCERHHIVGWTVLVMFYARCHLSLTEMYCKMVQNQCYVFLLFTVQLGIYLLCCIDLLCAESAGAVRDCLEGTTYRYTTHNLSISCYKSCFIVCITRFCSEFAAPLQFILVFRRSSHATAF